MGYEEAHWLKSTCTMIEKCFSFWVGRGFFEGLKIKLGNDPIM